MGIHFFERSKGIRSEGLGEEGIFGVFLSILGLSLFKQEGREDLKRAKVRKLTLTPSLMFLDLAKTLTLCFGLHFKVLLG